MRSLSILAAALSSALASQAAARSIPGDTPLPLVLWHGLGDAADAEGVRLVGELAAAVHPGIFFYPISLAADAAGDRQASFFGNVTEQVQAVCDALAAHPILSTAPAIDALGFSQGGQFLRAYVERCNAPPVRSLVTFGSQHSGIRQFRACAPADLLCRGAMALLRFSTWSATAQARLVPAQYFRDPLGDYAAYLAHSNFLADINNERPVKNARYRDNLRGLANFVLFLFEGDDTVVPKESAWFADAADEEGRVTHVRDSAMYAEDWLGLRELDEKGALRFRSVAGGHMQFGADVLNQTMREFFGPLGRTFAPEAKGTGAEWADL